MRWPRVRERWHDGRMIRVPSTPLFEGAARVCDALRAAGHRALWAGGCVRDLLMGRPGKDVDIATSATPDEVLALFPDGKAVGRAFGVVRVIRGEATYEVATFRSDAAYSDGRRPDSVTFTDERTDALRRDFTINALFFDPVSGDVLDYADGRADLDARVIRCVGDPATRFHEDHLRLLRAVRFASVLEFDIERATADAIRREAPHVRKISAERVRIELTRLFVESPRPGAGLRRLRDLDVLKQVLPEVAALEGCRQPPEYHGELDVLQHTEAALDAMGPGGDPNVAWALLLHDIGKPGTASVETRADGRTRIRFSGHAALGAQMAEKVLRRLKFSNEDRETIARCVDEHTRFFNVPNMRRSTLLQWAAKPWMDTLLEVHRLDRLAGHRRLDEYQLVRKVREELQRLASLPRPLVDGRVLMRAGVAAGPAMKPILAEIYNLQLEHPEWTRADLLRAWRAEGEGRDRRSMTGA